VTDELGWPPDGIVEHSADSPPVIPHQVVRAESALGWPTPDPELSRLEPQVVRPAVAEPGAEASPNGDAELDRAPSGESEPGSSIAGSGPELPVFDPAAVPRLRAPVVPPDPPASLSLSVPLTVPGAPALLPPVSRETEGGEADVSTAPPATVSRETPPLAPDAAPLAWRPTPPSHGAHAAAEESTPEDGPAAGAAAITPFPRPGQRRIIAVANQKGGVGKTTTTVNLAAALALGGCRVLVLDLDPQGNTSTALSVEHRAGTPSIYDVLVGNRGLDDVAVDVEGLPGLRCVPATIDLAGAEIELVSTVARENRLKRAFGAVREPYDYVLIDCPPSLGLLTVNALTATEELLIPIQCEYYALEGVGQLLHNVELIRSHLNPELVVSTVLLTMYDGRTRLAEQVAAEVRAHFGPRVLASVIPRSVRVSEAPSYGQSVLTYDPESRGALAYLSAAAELAHRQPRESL